MLLNLMEKMVEEVGKIYLLRHEADFNLESWIDI